jgi:multiple sugar transport system substrate-binding protein
MKRRFLLITSLLVVVSLLLAACGGGAAEPTPAAQAPAGAPAAEVPASSGGAVALDYWMWDANQLPAYQACTDAFMAANPNISVTLTQQGWDDYWSRIQNGFIAGDAPDVFHNHLAQYPAFASRGQLLDIQPYVDRDGVDLSVYLAGLAELWTRDGQRYGLPKDWDTVAIVYNKEMIEAAGITEEEINNTTWNPEDGGSFAELLAKLTLDQNGNNALSPDFDATKIKQYGMIPDGTKSAWGQTGWSWLAATTGWRAIDEMWGTVYHYDDPRFIATYQWFADMMQKKHMMPWELVSGLGSAAAFSAGNGALTIHGSWMISDFLTKSPFPVGFARLPQGPEGRKSMFNGLVDSIWVGTPHPEEAWQFVKFLASEECANIVGDTGVVFPARQSGVDRALAAHAAKGADVSAFTDQATDPDGTFLFPVTDFAADIVAIIEPNFESILLGTAKAADVMPPANAEVNALFQ